MVNPIYTSPTGTNMETKNIPTLFFLSAGRYAGDRVPVHPT
jgi:hypothetical protein